MTLHDRAHLQSLSLEELKAYLGSLTRPQLQGLAKREGVKGSGKSVVIIGRLVKQLAKVDSPATREDPTPAPAATLTDPQTIEEKRELMCPSLAPSPVRSRAPSPVSACASPPALSRVASRVPSRAASPIPSRVASPIPSRAPSPLPQPQTPCPIPDSPPLGAPSIADVSEREPRKLKRAPSYQQVREVRRRLGGQTNNRSQLNRHVADSEYLLDKIKTSLKKSTLDLTETVCLRTSIESQLLDHWRSDSSLWDGTGTYPEGPNKEKWDAWKEMLKVEGQAESDREQAQMEADIKRIMAQNRELELHNKQMRQEYLREKKERELKLAQQKEEGDENVPPSPSLPCPKKESKKASS